MKTLQSYFEDAAAGCAGGCSNATPGNTMGMGNPTESSGDLLVVKSSNNKQDDGRAHARREKLSKKHKHTSEEE